MRIEISVDIRFAYVFINRMKLSRARKMRFEKQCVAASGVDECVDAYVVCVSLNDTFK